MSYDIIEKLKREISGHTPDTKWESVGRILEVGDGIVKLHGLPKTVSQELLIIETSEGERRAVALNLEDETIGALVLDDYLSIKSGDVVKGTGDVLRIPVGDELLGRVVDPLGNPQDGLGATQKKSAKATYYTIENSAPSVLDREPVNTPLHTGVKSIDSMIPIGRGQRELLIGDRQTGKTAIALDTIINQKDTGVLCIYVAIGQKESKIARIVETLKKHGALDHTIIVLAGASSPAALWYLAPFAGASLGEYFRDSGRDALVVYDDLSKHAWAYRQISLLLRRPPGREAYPGDVFYLHSRLLERAAKLSQERGGGSLTALPIIETQEGDVSGYIPTNVISITDGQIFLESDLFNKGVRPAINAGISVSRVGSSAQTKAMKKVSGKIKLELAQFRELEAFMQFAQDLDQDTKKRIDAGARLMATLKQKNGLPMAFERQVVMIFAATNGYLEKVSVGRVPEFEEKMLAFLDAEARVVLESIANSKNLVSQTESELTHQLNKFVETHPDLFK